ncbi:MAG TPA: ATP-binding protein [Bryobacteraceae bacterium]|nr:ATP-binding protein [Bryobacteraceae bacterium]
MSRLAEELRGIPIFSDLSEDDLLWLASRMSETSLRPAEVYQREGDAADRMIVVLEGELHGRTEAAGADGPAFVVRAGQVTGLLPYSRMARFPSTVRAVAPSRVASLPAAHFREMLDRMPALGPRLVGLMADRIRATTRMSEQRERLAALGKLSAGLAHELNNPASAARRAATGLREAVLALRSANVRLDEQPFTTAQRAFLARLERDEAEACGASAPLDSLERSDREEEIRAWLDARGVAHQPELPGNLADAGVTPATLEQVAAQFPAEALGDVLVRLSATFTIVRLAGEIETGTARIAELVRAIKEYSHMDQAPEQEVDVHQGLESTLVMLRHRLKNGVQVARDYDRSLPRICGHPGELNQVWTNLIDNAIQAMKGEGILRVRTAPEPGWVLVEIGDNGPGIPPEVQSRLFEPFFTTKPHGEGTGLGLDTVYRIVTAHRGTVCFESEPGDTRFQVRLPAPQKGANP